MALLHNHIFLLLLITLLGAALGKLHYRSFSLGISGIIFVALPFGHFGYTLPVDFQTLGLVLFIYSVGLQAGPGFFHTFRKKGLNLSLGALAVIATGFVSAVAMSLIFDFDASITAGLFAGALTSTPGLAVAVETAGGNGAPAAYGLTYFFGVIGVILCIQLFPKILGISLEKEEQRLDEEATKVTEPITFFHIELSNPNIFNKKVKDLGLNDVAPVVFTRLLRNNASEPELVRGETLLKEGDHLRIAGREKDLEQIGPFLGHRIESEIEFDRVLEHKRIVVSQSNITGVNLSQLNCREVFNVQVSRVTRNGIDLPATPNLRLHLGDVVHAVGDSRSLANIARIFGNNVKETYRVNPLSIFIGLLLGFLLGKIPLYFPFAGKFTLGTTGGVLAAGILLSNLYKTGPFIWEIPSHVNAFLRDLGLILFMATVGTSTGATILVTLANQGLVLFFAGMVVTLVPLLAALLLCWYVLKLPFLRVLGVMAGSMTSTPGLAAVTELSTTHYASSAYATVYPVALVGMILCTKLLTFLLS